jgi:hypothetical protein
MHACAGTHIVSSSPIRRLKETRQMFTILLQTLPSSLPSLPSDTSFVAGWGTLSLVNAGLAQAKQSSGLLWWAFSLVLGPLATFLVVVLPKVERKTPYP